MTNQSDNGLFTPELLHEIRAQMVHVDADPYTGQRIYFENAGGSLRLQSVCEAVFAESAIPDNAGRRTAASAHVMDTIEQGKKDARLFFGATSGQVISAQTTTQTIFRAIRAIAENVSGSNIVTTNLEHPAIFDSTKLYADWLGKEWRVAELNPETGGVDTEQILAQIDEKTCLLGFIHASNITGTILDAEEIIREARRIKEDLFIVVDGTQHAPHAPVDVEALGCDAYFFAPYKILGKVGIGFGWIADRLAALPHEKLAGKKHEDWDLGTQEHAAYLAWTKVVDYLSWLGGKFTDSTNRRVRLITAMQKAENHERALLKQCLDGNAAHRGLLCLPEITLYGFADNMAEHDCVLALNIAGIPAPEAVQRYLDAGVAVHNRLTDAYSRQVLGALGVESLVRFSALHYNTPDEVDHFLAVTAELCGRNGG